MMRPTVQLALIAILLLAATTANSQSNFASLSGTVFDPQQQVVPGCTVQLSSVSTNSSRQATTNDLGIFQISGLLPGEYVLSVTAQGFSPVKQAVTLEVGQARTIDLTLKVAAVSTTVDVRTDSVNLLKTTDASVGEVVEPTAVQNLPLNGRMLIDLVLTVPGAHESHAAQANDMSPLYRVHSNSIQEMKTPVRKFDLCLHFGIEE